MLFRIKASVLSLFLLISVISLMNCSKKQPVLAPENVYSSPDFDFVSAKKIAYFLDHSKLPSSSVPDLMTPTEEELKNRGYSLVSNRDFVTFYNTSDIKIFDIYHPELLSKAKEKLDIEAIVQQKIIRFDIGEEALGMAHTVTAGGTRGMSMYSGQRQVWTYDIAMTFEIISIEKGNRVWSCSIALERFKYDKEPHKLIKEIVTKCFNTIPRHEYEVEE